MGSCINKSNNIISIRINEKTHTSNEQSSQKLISTDAPSQRLNSKKIIKTKFRFQNLYSNDISKILIIPEMKDNNDNDINNLNSIREIMDLF